MGNEDTLLYCIFKFTQSHSNTNDDTLNGNLTEEEALKRALELSLSNQIGNLNFSSNNNECVEYNCQSYNATYSKNNSNNNNNGSRMNEKKPNPHNWISCDEKEKEIKGTRKLEIQE